MNPFTIIITSKTKKTFFSHFYLYRMGEKNDSTYRIKCMEKNAFRIKKLFISKIQTNVQKEYYPNLYK